MCDPQDFVWVFHWPSAKTDIDGYCIADSIRESADNAQANTDGSRFPASSKERREARAAIYPVIVR